MSFESRTFAGAQCPGARARRGSPECGIASAATRRISTTPLTIVRNPVAAGLVDNEFDWPHSWSVLGAVSEPAGVARLCPRLLSCQVRRHHEPPPRVIPPFHLHHPSPQAPVMAVGVSAARIRIIEGSSSSSRSLPSKSPQLQQTGLAVLAASWQQAAVPESGSACCYLLANKKEKGPATKR